MNVYNFSYIQEHGPEVTRTFFDFIQKLINAWLILGGHSMSIADIVPTQEIIDKIQIEIDKSKVVVANITDDAVNEKLKATVGNTFRETFENNVNQVLNKAREVVGEEAQNGLTEFNNMKNMVKSGAKGSILNVSQLANKFTLPILWYKMQSKIQFHFM
eukprot:Awhi_evm1s10025